MNKGWRMSLAGVGVGLLVGLTALGWSRIGIDPNHDGIALKPAWDMVAGKVLYREVFSHYGPLTTYGHAAGLRLFGGGLPALKVVTAGAYSLSGILVWWLTGKLAGGKAAGIVVIGWQALAPYYYQHYYPWASVYASLCMLAAGCWWLARGEKEMKLSEAVIIGALTAAAFWYKQPYAAVVAGVGAGFWWRGRKKEIVGLGMGIVGLSGLLWGILAFSGGLSDWWKQTIWVGYINGRILGEGNSWANTINYFWRRPFWLVFLGECLWFSWTSGKNQGQKVKVRTEVGWFLSLSLINYLPLLDDSHMYWAATPVFPLWGAGMWGWLKQRNWRRTVGLIITALALVSELGVRISGGREKLQTNNHRIISPLAIAGMYTTRQTAQDLGEVAGTINRYLDAHPGKTLVSLSQKALYMAFDHRAKNIITLYCDLSGLASGVYPYHQEIRKLIDQDKPLLLLDIGQTEEGYQLIGKWDSLRVKLVKPPEENRLVN